MPNEDGAKRTKSSKLSRARRRRRRRWNKRSVTRASKRAEQDDDFFAIRSSDQIGAIPAPFLPKEHETMINANMQLWLQTYKSMTSRYQNHQLDYWYRKADNLQTENQNLKDKIKKLENLLTKHGIVPSEEIITSTSNEKSENLKPNSNEDQFRNDDGRIADDQNKSGDENENAGTEYVTSSDEKEESLESDKDLDPEYRQFIETTRRHREEWAAKKAAGLEDTNVLII